MGHEGGLYETEEGGEEMKISLECPCGAKVIFVDPRGTYINPGGVADKEGRVYVIQEHADRWIIGHGCEKTKK